MGTTESQVRSSQPIEKHTVAGEVARAVASWLYRRGCKHGETRARAASGSPEIWRRCAETLEIDTHGVHPEDLSEDPL